MKNMMPEYVDELKRYDMDMLEHNLDRNAKDYTASDPKEAFNIVRHLLDKTLKRTGVDISKDSSEEAVDALLEKTNVRVEHRSNYQEDDAWRNGIYIYKGMDLAGFISEPLIKRPGVFEPGKPPYVVVRAALQ
jgi:hypothetical protein